MTDASLMQAFGFDEGDLQANRAWELTERQQELLTATRTRYRNGIPQVALIIGGIMVVGTVISLLSGNTSPDELARGLPVCIPFFLVFVLIAVAASYLLTSNLRYGRIHVAKGRATLKTGLYRGHTPYYHTKIGRHTFYLASRAEFEAFKEGEQYHVYYIPYWPDVILSAERVDAEG